jgi:hypothetical protein
MAKGRPEWGGLFLHRHRRQNPFPWQHAKENQKKVKRILVVLKKCIFAIVNQKQLLSWNTASL